MFLDLLKKFSLFFLPFFLFSKEVTLTGNYLRYVCISNKETTDLNITVKFEEPGNCMTFSSYNFVTTKCDTDNNKYTTLRLEDLTPYLHFYNLELNASPEKIKLVGNDDFFAGECADATLARVTHSRIEDIDLAMLLAGIGLGIVFIGIYFYIIAKL